MKHLNRYSDLEQLNENWVANAVMKSSYDRDDEIREFFLELVDIGGEFKSVKNSSHTLIDKNFKLLDRINYITDPLYQSYLIRIRFEQLLNIIKAGDSDFEMEKTIDFFNELDDSFYKMKNFGYKFKLRKISFDLDSEIMVDVIVYHPDDIVPWEKIFTKE